MGFGGCPTANITPLTRAAAGVVAVEVEGIASAIKPRPKVLVTEAGKIAHRGLDLLIGPEQLASLAAAARGKVIPRKGPIWALVAEILKRKKS